MTQPPPPPGARSERDRRLYLEHLTRGLLARGMEGGRIGELVAELDDHMSRVSGDPVVELGPADDLARALADAATEARPWSWWIMNVLFAAAVGLVAAGLGALVVTQSDGTRVLPLGIAVLTRFHHARLDAGLGDQGEPVGRSIASCKSSVADRRGDAVRRGSECRRWLRGGPRRCVGGLGLAAGRGAGRRRGRCLGLAMVAGGGSGSGPSPPSPRSGLVESLGAVRGWCRKPASSPCRDDWI